MVTLSHSSKAGAGVPIVFVNFVAGDAVVPGVLGEDFDLRSDLSRAISAKKYKGGMMVP